MEVLYEPAALKGLKSMERADADRLIQALREVADSHPQRLSFVTEMVGEPNTWRARKGNYRAVFTIEGALMRVIATGHRKEVYR